jgi:hypothetical protein
VTHERGERVQDTPLCILVLSTIMCAYTADALSTDSMCPLHETSMTHHMHIIRGELSIDHHSLHTLPLISTHSTSSLSLAISD